MAKKKKGLKGKTRTISIRIPETLAQQLESLAEREVRSVNQTVIYYLQKAIGIIPKVEVEKIEEAWQSGVPQTAPVAVEGAEQSAVPQTQPVAVEGGRHMIELKPEQIRNRLKELGFLTSKDTKEE